eukprot:CAMPEP_0198247806 /NCGR_PEP_ID=MMETSP1446-20131203/46645_1 /TAXON_ID=1461542 ORGANISM="Unidentified sp, Strain CCMP2111" /NCGR_SAMPLE_ID=MMETSP1446 /ASSEMBLY_ACC=CAM_ASM_001112 /LENGTH=722 /DNA_ID=CAMNT_0043932135 /DNA_START=157 /DNA_END=2325 /DNA_ORIENTATION=+
MKRERSGGAPGTPGFPQETKRRRSFTRIPVSERCGTCDTCRNPQRKQACLVARAKLEEMRRTKETAAKEAAQARARAEAASFHDSLAPLIDAKGAVKSAEAARDLVALMRKQARIEAKTALIRVLLATCAAPQAQADRVLRPFIAEDGLKVLTAWLVSAVDDKYVKFVKKLVQLLSSMPVVAEDLETTEVAKVVRRVVKKYSDNEDVAEAAKKLFGKWVILYKKKESSQASPRPSSAKKEVLPLQTKNKLDGSQSQSSDVAGPAKPPQSSPAAKPASDSPTKRSVAMQGRAPSIDATRAVDTGNVGAPAVPPPEPVASSVPSAAGDAEDLRRHAPSSPADPTATSGRDRAATTTTTAPTSAAAGGASLSPEGEKPAAPAKKRVKRKKVTWKSDDYLESVRVFHIAQAPCKVGVGDYVYSPDDDDGSEVREAVNQLKKKEEAQINWKKIRKVQQEENERIRQELESMKPDIEWVEPPLCGQVAPESDQAISEEAERQRARERNSEPARDASTWKTPRSPPREELAQAGSAGVLQSVLQNESLMRNIQKLLSTGPAQNSNGGNYNRNGGSVGVSGGVAPNILSVIPNLQSLQGNIQSIQQMRPAQQPTSMNSIDMRAMGMASQPVPMHSQPQMQQPFGVMQRPQVLHHQPQYYHQPGTSLAPMHGGNQGWQPDNGRPSGHPIPSSAPPAKQKEQWHPPGKQRVCAYYKMPDGCVHGDNCKFSHP